MRTGSRRVTDFSSIAALRAGCCRIAYRRGALAACHGLAASAIPYAEFTRPSEARAWLAGWRAIRKFFERRLSGG